MATVILFFLSNHSQKLRLKGNRLRNSTFYDKSVFYATFVNFNGI